MSPASQSAVALERILLATDFSPAATAALAQAARLARTSGALLHIVHVIPNSAWKIFPQLTLQHRIDATQRLDQAAASPECSGLRVQCVLRHGAVVAQVLHVAEEHAVDLVVTGMRGPGLKRALFGSIAAKIARSAPCPVLTVGPRVAPLLSVVAPPLSPPVGGPPLSPPAVGGDRVGVSAEQAQQRGFTNIVLATGLNPGAAAGIDYACWFAEQHGAKLWIAHSLRPRDGVQYNESVGAWMDKVVPNGPGVGRVLEIGSVEHVAVALAERESADLLMLAPGLGWLLPEMVRHVACPVMTVRYATPIIRPKTLGAEVVTHQ